MALLELDHAQIAFGLVAAERDPQIFQKGPDSFWASDPTDCERYFV